MRHEDAGRGHWRGTWALATSLVVLISVAPAHAGDSSLDGTFGAGGEVTTAVSSTFAQAFAVAIQPDGKIVAAGSSYNGSNRDIAVARYSADGSLDPGFGTAGIVTTQIGSGDDDGRAVAIQQDGKIVVAGSSDQSTNVDFAVVRYNADGSLDPGFGSAGFATTAIVGGADALSVALQPDGKIVAAGTTVGPDSIAALVRYNADGSADASFGTAGIVTTNVAGRGIALSVAIQPDGKIIAAGYSPIALARQATLMRYGTDGSLDSTFGSNGVATSLVGTDTIVSSVALQPDGKIVAAGSSTTGKNTDVAVLRYQPDGTPDPKFGTDGHVISDLGGTIDQGLSIALQPDGRIVTAGTTTIDGRLGGGVGLARYRTDGSLETTFGTTAAITSTASSPAPAAVAHSVAVQPDGKVVVAGLTSDDSHDGLFMVLRYVASPPIEATGRSATSSGGSHTWLVVGGVGVGAVAIVAGVGLLARRRRSRPIAG
jgi:uncharacterized delta-60 repeat protein